jgi:hypothetical protein
MRRHKVDNFGCNLLGGDGEIALIISPARIAAMASSMRANSSSAAFTI